MSNQLNLSTEELDELQADLLKLGGEGNPAAMRYSSLMAAASNDEERLQVATELCNEIQSLIKWFKEFNSWWAGARETCPELPANLIQATPRVEPEGSAPDRLARVHCDDRVG